MRFPQTLLFAAVAATFAGCGEDRSVGITTGSLTEPEQAVISTTEGDMTILFRSDQAPATVENFKKLARSGFYDGTNFHRVMRNFMIQGGDPLTKDPARMGEWGQGGPGYKLKAEFNDISHRRGVVSMARSADPDSAGSQFFICHGNPTFLDGKYTAFGKLIKGDDVLDRIATADVQGERPLRPVVIRKVTIEPVPAGPAL